MATLTAEDAIRLANELVGIEKSFQIMGLDALAGVKNYCPFGEFYHVDNGRSRSMRLYPATNSGWCFACSTYFTPVLLVSRLKGISEENAAEFLLETIGYVAPDPDSRWEALTSQRLDFDHAAESEALKMYCARVDPRWSDRQFDPHIAALLTRCLTPLGKVTTQEELQRWRTTTRAAMTKALTKRQET